MDRREFISNTSKYAIAGIIIPGISLPGTNQINISVEQLTHGNNHHFFGYIGQSLTIPWNKKEDRILCLSTNFHNRLAGKGDPANVNIIYPNEKNGNSFKIEKVDECLGWNHQQGTMFYWNPNAPESQFFFNDRDSKTGVVNTVLYDLSKGKRIKVYKYDNQSFGNSGVCPLGKYFLAINYARMARLRPVTGYKDTYDWSKGIAAPKEDGIAIIDIDSGEKRMLISFEQIAKGLDEKGFDVKGRNLFINHTLWSRDGKWIYFFVRAGWKADKDGREGLNAACTIKVDGSHFTPGHIHIGGHPEWSNGTEIIGAYKNEQVVYDIISRKITKILGNKDIFPKPGGDVSLSPNSEWIVNGYNDKAGSNHYSIMNLKSGIWTKTPSFNTGIYKGDLRIDPAPRWNHKNNKILVSGLDKNKVRQLFVLNLEY